MQLFSFVSLSKQIGSVSSTWDGTEPISSSLLPRLVGFFVLVFLIILFTVIVPRKSLFCKVALRHIGEMGNKKINSSIGSQWKSRIKDLDTNIRDIAKTMTQEERESTFLNIKLKISN
ncbi:polymorphic toxin type 15 domain-containing protein [Parageobacillus thermoglucosidasius]|uniref:polymorphic toxin type 15 domain-containing protein n=2 Tax=Parageobacillus thermoglucosidasius TaxID=1426 RepID=UPI0009B68820|nr:polymorphic toxin type 15 domain-containing protein [Parageobacillus thermoglucosidasius]